jgi:hypothetical protein
MAFWRSRLVEQESLELSEQPTNGHVCSAPGSSRYGSGEQPGAKRATNQLPCMQGSRALAAPPSGNSAHSVLLGTSSAQETGPSASGSPMEGLQALCLEEQMLKQMLKLEALTRQH